MSEIKYDLYVNGKFHSRYDFMSLASFEAARILGPVSCEIRPVAVNDENKEQTNED